MKKKLVVAILFSLISNYVFADYQATKKEILALAAIYEGQGDQDGSKQKSLEILVERLLQENPQAPLHDRLPMLAGAWRQVWGPYDYSGKDRGIDPKLDVKNIIQVIFDDGYYYNVNPTKDRKGNIKSTTMLRGEYVLDENRPDVLNVQFTNLRKIKGLPSDGLRLQDLPALSEARNLKGEKTVLPGFLVRSFFGGGSLREVYTDEDLRITFGSSRDNSLQDYIYILKKVPSTTCADCTYGR